MMINVSWIDYSIGIVLVMCLYYLIVGLQYYPTEGKQWLSGKGRFSLKTPRFKENRGRAEVIVPVDAQESLVHPLEGQFQEMASLITAVKDTIALASKRQYIPQEFRAALVFVLQGYPQIQHSSFRTAINALILSECQKYGTITLSEEDVVRLWDNEVF